ncbi:MAG: hypothetical protein WD054_04880 [Gemmatimonadota bacterium]
MSAASDDTARALRDDAGAGVDGDLAPSRRFRTVFAAAMILIALGWSWVWREKTDRVAVEAPPVIAVVSVTTDTMQPGNTPRLVGTLSVAFARVPGLTVVSADRLFGLSGGDSAPAALVEAARVAGAGEVLEVVLTRDASGGYALDAERTDAGTREARGALRSEGASFDDAVDLLTAHVAMRFGLAVPEMDAK